MFNQSSLSTEALAMTAREHATCDTCPFSSADADAIRGHEAGPSTGRGWLGRHETHTMLRPDRPPEPTERSLRTMARWPSRDQLIAKAEAECQRPTAEWQAAADAEPYRIACHAITHRRAPWHVVDIRPDDEPTVAGPFRTREEAMTAAAALNAGRPS